MITQLLSARGKSSIALVLCGLTTVLPVRLAAQTPDPWLPGSTSATHYREFLPFSQLDPNPTGLGGTLSADMLTFAPTNPFFQALGTNGRTCATCHQPETQ